MIQYQPEQQYEVERIISKKWKINPESKVKQVWYLIKWLNYPESANTWEQQSFVQNAPLKIKEFQRTYQKQNKRKQSKQIKKTKDSDKQSSSLLKLQQKNVKQKQKQSDTIERKLQKIQPIQIVSDSMSSILSQQVSKNQAQKGANKATQLFLNTNKNNQYQKKANDSQQINKIQENIPIQIISSQSIDLSNMFEAQEKEKQNDLKQQVEVNRYNSIKGVWQKKVQTKQHLQMTTALREYYLQKQTKSPIIIKKAFLINEMPVIQFQSKGKLFKTSYDIIKRYRPQQLIAYYEYRLNLFQTAKNNKQIQKPTSQDK